MKDAFADKLAQGRMKLTRQRQVILDVLEEHRGEHLTAEEIYLAVKTVMPGIGLATVYRNLEMMARLEIIHKTSFDERGHRYEFCEAEGHFHHHFICLTCGSILEVKDDLLHALESEMERKGFVIVDHSLKLYGHCPECRPHK